MVILSCLHEERYTSVQQEVPLLLAHVFFVLFVELCSLVLGLVVTFRNNLVYDGTAQGVDKLPLYC